MGKKHDAINFQDLTPAQHIRMRPGMYFSGTDRRGIHILFLNVIDVAVDQAVKKLCNAISVTLLDDATVSVRDSGIGMPVHKRNDVGNYFTEGALTKVGMGGQLEYFDLAYYTYESMGMMVANAACSEFHIEIKREGYLWAQSYKEGVPQTEFRQIRPLAPEETTGSTVTFRPDFTVFDENEFDYDYIANRMNGVAYCIPGLSITVSDERSNHKQQSHTFHHPDGVTGFIQHLNREHQPLHEPIVFSKQAHIPGFNGYYDDLPITVDIAIQYVRDSQPAIFSYINGKYFSQRSEHERTFLRSIEQALHHRQSWTWSGLERIFAQTGDVFCGLTAIIIIWHPDIHFEDKIWSTINNPEPASIILDAVLEAFETLHEAQPEQYQRIIEHIEAQMQQRENRRLL